MQFLVILRLWVSLGVLDRCLGIRVLLLNPMFAPSHFLALRTLTDNLLDRGHSVTVVRLEPHPSTPLRHANLTEIVLTIDNSNGTIPLLSHEPIGRFQMPTYTWSQGIKPWFMPIEGCFTVAAHCKALLSNRARINWFRKQQFDVAIVDLVYNECSLGLAHHLKLPVVGYWGLTFAGYEPMHTAIINPPSTIPYILSGLPRQMNFRERLYNFFLHAANTVIMAVQLTVTHRMTQQYLPNTPHPSDLLMNISGALINTHAALDIPKQLPPSYLEIGGFHIRPTKPLPENIRDFLGNSTSGVVLFSLGCTFDAAKVPKAVIRNVLSAFAQLPFKILMRIGGKAPPLPENVMAVSWLPQNDVLANPNIRAFVTHCGMHGVMEALHHGVPMVGMPIFGDQLDISVRLQEKDLAVIIGKDFRVDQLRDAIMEVVTNPKYSDNAASMKQIMHHRRVSPLEAATWLVEHVAITEGADHLKPLRLHLNTLQLYCVDLILFYFVMLTALFYIPYVWLKKVLYGSKAKRIHEMADVKSLIPGFCVNDTNSDVKLRKERAG